MKYSKRTITMMAGCLGALCLCSVPVATSMMAMTTPTPTHQTLTEGVTIPRSLPSLDVTQLQVDGTITEVSTYYALAYNIQLHHNNIDAYDHDSNAIIHQAMDLLGISAVADVTNINISLDDSVPTNATLTINNDQTVLLTHLEPSDTTTVTALKDDMN